MCSPDWRGGLGSDRTGASNAFAVLESSSWRFNCDGRSEVRGRILLTLGSLRRPWLVAISRA